MASQATSRVLRNRVLLKMAGGVGVISLPIGAWWYMAQNERKQHLQTLKDRIVLPGTLDTYDFLIAEKIQPGDVLVFDRSCSKCATSPWAALACLASKSAFGPHEHVGLVVPGFANTDTEALDPTNLCVLEATPHGIVAHKVKERLERSQSGILLLQLCGPGEQRNSHDQDNEMVIKTKAHVERQLKTFRDKWLQVSKDQRYATAHSTVTIGGALFQKLGLAEYSEGPVSPSAFLVQAGLQFSSVAVNLNEKHNRLTQPGWFLQDYRFQDTETVRLRPGWRFKLPAIPLKEKRGSSGL